MSQFFNFISVFLTTSLLKVSATCPPQGVVLWNSMSAEVIVASSVHYETTRGQLLATPVHSYVKWSKFEIQSKLSPVVIYSQWSEDFVESQVFHI